MSKGLLLGLMTLIQHFISLVFPVAIQPAGDKSQSKHFLSLTSLCSVHSRLCSVVPSVCLVQTCVYKGDSRVLRLSQIQDAQLRYPGNALGLGPVPTRASAWN